MIKFDIGDKVKFINPTEHQEWPKFYPEVGTVGKILDIDEYNYFLVQWPEGTVEENAKYHGDYSWWVRDDSVELAGE